ncbi:MAG: hypothetical protein KF861_04100 [Planctomycetaceae bacterium]|nr:hypothetical protein [Planctomycetaceae bacterium]
MLKLGILALSCSSAISLAILFLAPASGAAAPEGLVAVRPVLEFGDITWDDDVSGEFQLVNHAPVPITVRHVVKSCEGTLGIR